MGFFDFGTIFFLVAAVVIFFQLRNVLGRRTGNERPPFDPYTAGRTAKDAAGKPENVVSLPRKRAPGDAGDEAYAAIDVFAKPGTDLNRGLGAEEMDHVGLFGADFMRELEAVITYRESRIFLIQRAMPVAAPAEKK